MKINKNYEKMQDSYLFATIAQKVAAYSEKHPDKEIIKMGIGDVTIPLCNAVVEAGVKAVKEMG